MSKEYAEDPQELQHWYIAESGEGVRVNLVMTYTDFFSGRTYGEHPNKLMYSEEADRAKREGYAVSEPVYKALVMKNFEDNWLSTKGNTSKKPRPRTKGQVIYCTADRLEELESLGLVRDASKPDKYNIATL